MITEQQYNQAVIDEKSAQEIINAYHKQKRDDFDARWNRFLAGEEFFKDEELRYSAGARCDACGSGLAYPKDCGVNHMWSCSKVLKGLESDRGVHIDYPFAFYSIKSEDQPSARGSTTRPSENL